MKTLVAKNYPLLVCGVHPKKWEDRLRSLLKAWGVTAHAVFNASLSWTDSRLERGNPPVLTIGMDIPGNGIPPIPSEEVLPWILAHEVAHLQLGHFTVGSPEDRYKLEVSAWQHVEICSARGVLSLLPPFHPNGYLLAKYCMDTYAPLLNIASSFGKTLVGGF